jgi:thiamine transport system permease protein
MTGTQESVSRELGKQGEARGKNLFTFLYLGGLALFVGGPLLSIPIESFLSRSTRAAGVALSLRWWRELGTSVLPALGRSLVLGSAAAGIATGLALMAALAKGLPGKKTARSSGFWLDALVSATLVSSGIVLGLGWIRLYGPLASRSFWALAMVHGVIALPFAYRSVGEGLASIPPSMLKASATMGDPPWRTILFVVLPASARYTRSAWAFAMTISLGELNGALMLGIEEFETLPLLVYRATGAYRFGTACAAGTVLALACAGSFMLSKEKA